MPEYGTELIRFPAEKCYAELAAVSAGKDNGKNINHLYGICAANLLGPCNM